MGDIMFIVNDVWGLLNKMEKAYVTEREKGTLKPQKISNIKYAYKTTLSARMERLKQLSIYDIPERVNEYEECDFLMKMLENGWTPGDMTLFALFFDMIKSLEGPALREKGDGILIELMDKSCPTVETRIEMLTKITGFTVACGNLKPAQDILPHINKAMNADILPVEYSDDYEYAELVRNQSAKEAHILVDKGKPIREYTQLYENAMKRANQNEAVKQTLRDKKDYVLSDKTDYELEKFKKSSGHKAHNLEKSTKNAIKEVYGDEIYDDIDEMSKGDEKDRTVEIHHALGNYYLRKGEEVLELDYAGSGFKEVRREYHGQHGKMFADGTSSSAESIESEFGKLVKKNDGSGKTFKYLRAKTSPEIVVGGKTLNKTRYSIAGPSPEHGGIWNLGEYSIENTRKYGRDFSADFLTRIFEKWERGEESPHDIHINLTGHSRGAVAAGECVRLVDKWIKDYVKKHPAAENYRNSVKFDMLLRDPVPGIITNWRLGSQDLRKYENVNATVFCSVVQEHSDLAFPLQNIRGAKRVVIGAAGHNMDLGNIDFSQLNQKNDGNTHKEGFYDAETGELFRGSGIADMPDGVYIADNNFNVIRITSYSQVSKLINAIYDGKTLQKNRVNTIHDMVRNWFVDNDLKMGFSDEEARNDAFNKNNTNIKKLLNAKSKRLRPIKIALRKLQAATERGGAPEEIVELQESLIRAGKNYMAKTSIPNSGDSQYRMDLVSDIVSFTMKDKNYIVRKNNLDYGNDLEGRALDKKILDHKQRLLNKKGALKRKLDKAEKRQVKAENAMDNILQIKKFCTAAVKNLYKTNKGLETSTYERYYSTLLEGEGLSSQTTISQFKDLMARMAYAAADYNNFSGESGRSKEGKIRLEQNNKTIKLVEELFKAFDKNTRFIPDKNKAIGKIVKEYRSETKRLKDTLLPKSEVEEAKTDKAKTALVGRKM